MLPELTAGGVEDFEHHINFASGAVVVDDEGGGGFGRVGSAADVEVVSRLITVLHH